MFTPKFCLVNHITLKNFRNYHNLSLALPNNPLIVIHGDNGIGKTSILEGISLFSSGKGLKGEKLENLLQHQQLQAYLEIQVTTQLGIQNLELSIESTKENSLRKLYYNMGKQLTSKVLIHSLIDCIWLTPQMDNFFLQDNNHKRKFIDKMISTLDKTHLIRLTSYEKLVKERNRVLMYSSTNTSWLNILDKQIIEYAVPIVASRIAFIDKMNKILQAKATYNLCLAFNGSIEDLFKQHTFSLLVEQSFCQQLLQSRELDIQTKTTAKGAHKSKLVALSNSKPCEFMSTGEQKMMLLSIISAFTQLCIEEQHTLPILLLDELQVHLDDTNTYNIISNLLTHGCQIFTTTTNPTIYKTLPNVGFVNLHSCNHLSA